MYEEDLNVINAQNYEQDISRMPSSIINNSLDDSDEEMAERLGY